jgi:hypothetical protein
MNPPRSRAEVPAESDRSGRTFCDSPMRNDRWDGEACFPPTRDGCTGRSDEGRPSALGGAITRRRNRSSTSLFRARFKEGPPGIDAPAILVLQRPISVGTAYRFIGRDSWNEATLICRGAAGIGKGSLCAPGTARSLPLGRHADGVASGNDATAGRARTRPWLPGERPGSSPHPERQ